MVDLKTRPSGKRHATVALLLGRSNRQRPGVHRARVPGRVRFNSRPSRFCVPKGPSPSVRACHGGMPRRGRTCPGLPWGPTVPVASLLLFHGELSETPPQPRAVFLMVCIVSGGILRITSNCGTFIILVTSASSSLRNRPVAPLVPASETANQQRSAAYEWIPAVEPLPARFFWCATVCAVMQPQLPIRRKFCRGYLSYQARRPH